MYHIIMYFIDYYYYLLLQPETDKKAKDVNKAKEPKEATSRKVERPAECK